MNGLHTGEFAHQIKIHFIFVQYKNERNIRKVLDLKQSECYVLAEETSELLQDSSGHPQGPDQLLLRGQAAPGRDPPQDEVPAPVVRKRQFRTHLKVCSLVPLDPFVSWGLAL